MCDGRTWVLMGVLLAVFSGVESLKDVSVTIPPAVKIMDTVTLQCRYDLQGEPLYTVKWYKGGQEFFRYIPKELPSTQVFPLPGINVDLSKSSPNEVVLRNVQPEVTGRYKCEVSSDAPNFYTFIVSGYMYVIVIFCLKDVVLEIEPEIVHLGEDSTLRCSYDLEDAPLYCVKWYRGRHEFYRYTPKEHPSTKIFPFPGIHVDLKQSDEKQVVLREVGFSLSGKFTCEVTTDAPLFSTAAVSKDMLVVVLPVHPPSLATEKNIYDSGEILRANCSSPPSRPAATLTFLLNDEPICERCATRKHATQDLWWSELTLQLPLFPNHFVSDRISLKCIARIGKIYEKDVQVSLLNVKVKDPIPARVTQSSAGCHYIKTFNVINILLLFIFVFC